MNYDLGIIGGGPAGYTAAFQARQKGLSVVLFEKDKVGGVCSRTVDAENERCEHQKRKCRGLQNKIMLADFLAKRLFRAFLNY